MKVKVDEETCVGCGTCVEVCPQLLEMVGEKAVAKTEIVPPELEGLCKDAADSCPVAAIIIED